MVFITDHGNYYYMVMILGLKNGGAMYKKSVNTILEDLTRKKVDTYIDNMVVKNQRVPTT